MENSEAAYNLMKKLQGELDLQTCKCLLNIADVYLHFEKKEEATEQFKKFIALFEKQNGQEGRADWSVDEKFVKLKEFADGRLEQMNEEEGGDEYYDEE